MPRRRSFLPRPQRSLHAAAATHEKIVAGEPHEADRGASDDEETATEHEGEPRTRRPRDSEGRYV